MSEPSPPLRILVLGSGTSVGVPTLACPCPVCHSPDPRDNRLRASVLFRHGARNYLIDTTPDFRTQALRARMDRLDAVLLTHAHADHIMGLDDIRPFNYRQGPIPVYGSAETLDAVRRIFSYIFEREQENTNIPKLHLREIGVLPFPLDDLTVTPIPVWHGAQQVLGFRIGRAAYLTDHSDIPESSLALLEGLDVLFLDALRHRPHPTHTTVAQALSYVDRLAPKRAFFTHIAHELGHEETEKMLPPHVRLAYDGLEILVEDHPS